MKWFEYNVLSTMIETDMGFSQVAEKMKVSRDAAAMMIARGNPHQAQRERLAKALGVSVDDLEREG